MTYTPIPAAQLRPGDTIRWGDSTAQVRATRPIAGGVLLWVGGGEWAVDAGTQVVRVVL